MFGVVDVAKVVAARCALDEVGSEERRRQAGLGVVKEGLLLVRRYRVDGRKPEAEKAVAWVLHELSADARGELHCLRRDCRTAHIDAVCVYVATGRASVAVRDGPCLA